jgi:glutamine cyclotransferase
MNIIRPGLFLLILTLPTASTGSQNLSQDFLCQADHFANQKAEAEKASSVVFPRLYSYQLVARYPHDSSAFTQGLVFYKENLFESIGLLDKSEVRKVNINDGEILLKTDTPDIYFGEGLALLKHQIVQMSWKSGKVFFFHSETLALIKKLNFGKEVWGSTTINGQLVLSNGSSNLLFINPENLSINKTLKITLNNKELSGLNELEYAEGYIYANVWPTHCIVRIDPVNGKVLGWLNLSKLYPDEYQLPDSAVLNGIAYDKQKKHFFVTGKFWPYLYEIKLQSNEY